MVSRWVRVSVWTISAWRAARRTRVLTRLTAREMTSVTHGGSMNIALAYLEGKSIADFVLVSLENCALRTVVIPARG